MDTDGNNKEFGWLGWEEVVLGIEVVITKKC